MKIEEFWNKAFIAALSRLPADQAKAEADLATRLCIRHWQDNRYHWAPGSGFTRKWQSEKIENVHFDWRVRLREAAAAETSSASTTD